MSQAAPKVNQNRVGPASSVTHVRQLLSGEPPSPLALQGLDPLPLAPLSSLETGHCSWEKIAWRTLPPDTTQTPPSSLFAGSLAWDPVLLSLQQPPHSDLFQKCLQVHASFAEPPNQFLWSLPVASCPLRPVWSPRALLTPSPRALVPRPWDQHFSLKRQLASNLRPWEQRALGSWRYMGKRGS